MQISVSSTSSSEIPPEFLCPISQELMVHPFTTAAGNSYEYAAIAHWLEGGRRTDPMTNVVLADTTLFPNNSLRSSIQAWLELNPEHDAEVRGRNVPSPPKEAYAAAARGGEGKKGGAADSALARVLRVHKSFELERKGAAAGDKPDTRILEQQRKKPVAAFGHIYTWDAEGKNIRCDNGPWVEAPEPDLFVTPQGVLFFDCTATLDLRVLPGTDLAKACKFGATCNKSECPYAHPFVCKLGTRCRDISEGKCKFFHPSAESVVPMGTEYPLNKECKYNTACTRLGCRYAHPCGRMSVARELSRVMVTHSLTLEELAAPVNLPFSVGEGCTAFQVQGEFLFAFEPYPGPWARDHYRRVTVSRFDKHLSRYRTVHTYELDKHYCNCAVAAGRYLVISFWPYENEAMRTVWECMRVGRTMEKALRSNSTELNALRNEVADLKAQLSEKEKLLQEVQGQNEQLRKEVKSLQYKLKKAHREIASRDATIAYQGAKLHRQHVSHQRQVRELNVKVWQARSATAQARSEAREQRHKVEALQRQTRSMQRDYERQRNERLRLRDPIHVYALRAGCEGFGKDDWALVLDYHKGAHDLALSLPDGPSGTQLLEVREHSVIVQFEMCVPGDVMEIGAPLPLQPGWLCDEF